MLNVANFFKFCPDIFSSWKISLSLILFHVQSVHFRYFYERKFSFWAILMMMLLVDQFSHTLQVQIKLLTDWTEYAENNSFWLHFLLLIHLTQVFLIENTIYNKKCLFRNNEGLSNTKNYIRIFKTVLNKITGRYRLTYLTWIYFEWTICSFWDKWSKYQIENVLFGQQWFNHGTWNAMMQSSQFIWINSNE